MPYVQWSFLKTNAGMPTKDATVPCSGVKGKRQRKRMKFVKLILVRVFSLVHLPPLLSMKDYGVISFLHCYSFCFCCSWGWSLIQFSRGELSFATATCNILTALCGVCSHEEQHDNPCVCVCKYLVFMPLSGTARDARRRSRVCSQLAPHCTSWH